MSGDDALRERVRAHGAQLVDHEQRIRALERWRYGVPTAAVCSAVGVLMQVAMWAR